MTEERASLLQRFRTWRTLRKRKRYERNNRARENLKYYKPPPDHGGGVARSSRQVGSLRGYGPSSPMAQHGVDRPMFALAPLAARFATEPPAGFGAGDGFETGRAAAG